MVFLNSRQERTALFRVVVFELLIVLLGGLLGVLLAGQCWGTW